MTYIYLIFQKSARIILQSYKKIYSIEHLSETANGIHKKAATPQGKRLKENRGERIRTSGLYVPNVALYQAKLHLAFLFSPLWRFPRRRQAYFPTILFSPDAAAGAEGGLNL